MKPHTVPKNKRWKKNVHQKKRQALRESNLQPHTLKDCKLPCSHQLSYMITCQDYMYLYVRIYKSGILTKKRKEHPLQGDDASTAEAPPGRVGRDEQEHIEQTPHRIVDLISIELRRLRLKTWPKSDVSIAQAWPTYLYIYLHKVCMHVYARAPHGCRHPCFG